MQRLEGHGRVARYADANYQLTLKDINYSENQTLYIVYFTFLQHKTLENTDTTRMWASAQRDGRHAKYRWHLLFNAAKFG